MFMHAHTQTHTCPENRQAVVEDRAVLGLVASVSWRKWMDGALNGLLAPLGLRKPERQVVRYQALPISFPSEELAALRSALLSAGGQVGPGKRALAVWEVRSRGG